MPKRMTYDEFMERPDVQKILGKFVQDGRNIIRRTDLRQGMHHAVLQRLLSRLIGEGVLMKVNRQGKPIRGGKRAPETYYMLLGEHWRTAIKAADINRLREQGLDRMTSGLVTTIYGLDVSDFDEHEEEKRQFLEVLEEIEALTYRLMYLKARMAQDWLNKTLSRLRIEDVNPLTKWLVEYHAWSSLVAPLVGIGQTTLDEFLRKAATTIPLVYERVGKLEDDETKKLVKCVIGAMRFVYQHKEEYENIVQNGAGGKMRGMVVAHMTPSATLLESAHDRAEDRFRRFLRGEGKEGDSEGPFFEWLKEFVPTEEDLKSSVVPFRSILYKHKGETSEELEAQMQELEEGTNLPFMVRALRTGMLDPPSPPDIDDLRDYWRTEETKEA